MTKGKKTAIIVIVIVIAVAAAVAAVLLLGRNAYNPENAAKIYQKWEIGSRTIKSADTPLFKDIQKSSFITFGKDSVKIHQTMYPWTFNDKRTKIEIADIIFEIAALDSQNMTLTIGNDVRIELEAWNKVVPQKTPAKDTVISRTDTVVIFKDTATKNDTTVQNNN